jgi:hypothetical protein
VFALIGVLICSQVQASNEGLIIESERSEILNHLVKIKETTTQKLARVKSDVGGTEFSYDDAVEFVEPSKLDVTVVPLSLGFQQWSEA